MKNYEGSASGYLFDCIESSIYSEEEIPDIQQIIGIIDNSQHFTVPDGGLILKKGWDSVISDQVRIPFETITISFNDVGNRMLMIVCEVPPNYYVPTNRKSNTGGDVDFMIYFMGYNEDRGIWSLSGYLVICKNTPSTFGVDFGIYHYMPRIFDIHSQYYGKDYDSVVKAGAEKYVGVLFEFLEALSCDNVSISTHTPAARNNAKRIKKGKLPIYETKILTIDPLAEKTGGVSTGTGKPKRQHLRRGHWRYLKHKRIWINHQTVGDAKNGII